MNFHGIEEAFVLAGGKSSRMGTNKALLFVDNVTMIERIVGVLPARFQKVSIVAKDAEPYEFLSVPICRDLHPFYSPLVGIYSGLKTIGRGGAFFTACDFPFLTADLVSKLLDVSGCYDAICFESDAVMEPFPSIFFKSALPLLKQLIMSNQLGVRSCLKALNVHKIPIQRDFASINTPKDYEIWKELHDSAKRA